MSNVNDAVTLSGLVKRVYGKKTIQLMPDNAIIQQTIPFSQGEKIGEAFYESIRLTGEHGFTYVGANAGGAPAIKPAIAGTVKQARIDSNEILGQAELGYKIAAKAMAAPNEKAFEKALDSVMDSLTLSGRKRIESTLLYGGEALAIVASTSGAVVTITAASFASGLWAGMEGAEVDIYSAAGVLRGTATITKAVVKRATRALTLDALPAGTVATDEIWLAGTKGNQALGMSTILKTSNASLFGIDNSNYGLWEGNLISSVGNVTLSAFDEASVACVDKGYSGDLDIHVDPYIWTDLNSQVAGRIRHYDGAKKAKEGFNYVEYSGVTGGTLRFIPNPCVKQGDAFGIAKGTWKRIGTVDLKLGDPLGQDDIVVRMPYNMGYQVINYSDQALFTNRPGYNFKMEGITKA